MSRTDKDRPRRFRDDPPWRCWWKRSAPHWYINQRWSARDRLAVRLAGQLARAEHRAGRTPEAEPPTLQHRHCASWEWN
ncbi:hypothetical protein V6V47_11750 [Micromonospora sp. CPCC 205539]|uniref:hypothetical protein n=1 Tax=Micromonospora sp. CPCC 205539 TaxID=3122408 RepID=UPI002FF3DC4A